MPCAMAQTALAIAQFSKIIEGYSARIEDAQLKRISNSIEKSKRLNVTIYDEKTVARYLQERAKKLKELVDNYFVGLIANKFPLVSDELFQLKRYFVLTSENKNYKITRDNTDAEECDAKREKEAGAKIKRVESSLFVYVPLFGEQKSIRLSSFTKRTETSWGDPRKKTINIEASVPDSNELNFKSAYRNALNHYFNVLSKMYEDAVTGDVMSINREVVQPEVGIIWIPTIQSLNMGYDERLLPRKKDVGAAVILKANGKNYLVQTCKIESEGEQSFGRVAVQGLGKILSESKKKK